MGSNNDNIFNKLNTEKIIYGINNNDFSIKFIKSYIWIIPLTAILLNISVLFILNNSEKIIAITIMVLELLLSILGFLNSSYTLYIDSNNIILENMLKKKLIIDVNKYPRIYIQPVKFTPYNQVTGLLEETQYNYDNLHIKQDNTDIVLNIKYIGINKINLMLDNFKMKDKENSNESEWLSSLDQEEKTFLNYIDFLNKQEKIIGVKDINYNMKISNNYKQKSNLIKCLLITVICYILAFFIPIAIEFFGTIGAFLSLLDLYFFIKIAEKGRNNNLKISYPKDGIIKINKYTLDYRNNDCMIFIRNKQSFSSSQKYNYVLTIDDSKKFYYIDLNLSQEQLFGNFIDNLIFKTKIEK